jgi:hypothetical protein
LCMSTFYAFRNRGRLREISRGATTHFKTLGGVYFYAGQNGRFSRGVITARNARFDAM